MLLSLLGITEDASEVPLGAATPFDTVVLVALQAPEPEIIFSERGNKFSPRTPAFKARPVTETVVLA